MYCLEANNGKENRQAMAREPITEDEIKKVRKLAERKSGVTKKELQEKLGLHPRRSNIILTKKIKAEAKRLGELGKASRTLTFFAKA